MGFSKCISGLYQVLVSTLLMVYYILESIILVFIPWRLWFKDVSSEIVLITGASSGIGRELAIKFSKLCAKVVLVDINGEQLERTREMIREDSTASCTVHTCVCDVSEPHEVYAMASKVRQEAGPVTILVNNAGIVAGDTLLQLSDQSIKKTMAVNALAHFWMCKAFLPDMISAKHGHIVTVASLAAYTPLPKLTDYCASKAAAAAFMDCLRLELEMQGHDFIKLTLVAPYHVATPLFKGFRGFSMLSTYSPEWVAERMVRGILSNQEFLAIPSFFTILLFLNAVVPRKVTSEVVKRTGLMQCMDGFKSNTHEKHKKNT